MGPIVFFHLFENAFSRLKADFDGKKGQVTYFIALPDFVEGLLLSALLLAASNHWTPHNEIFWPAMYVNTKHGQKSCLQVSYLTNRM